jgi:hypothetical protein
MSHSKDQSYRRRLSEKVEFEALRECAEAARARLDVWDRATFKRMTAALAKLDAAKKGGG